MAGDTLQGVLGRDILDGGEGDDVLIGGGGAAVLAGSEGDTLFGGPGSDIFRYRQRDVPPLGTYDPVTLPHGFDEIVDFNQGNGAVYDPSEWDLIDISEIVGAAYAGGTGSDVAELVRLRQSAFIDRVILESGSCPYPRWYQVDPQLTTIRVVRLCWKCGMSAKCR